MSGCEIIIYVVKVHFELLNGFEFEHDLNYYIMQLKCALVYSVYDQNYNYCNTIISYYNSKNYVTLTCHCGQICKPNSSPVCFRHQMTYCQNSSHVLRQYHMLIFKFVILVLKSKIRSNQNFFEIVQIEICSSINFWRVRIICIYLKANFMTLKWY